MKARAIVCAIVAATLTSSAFAQHALNLVNEDGTPEYAYASVPHCADLEPQELTIEAWMTPRGIGQGGTYGNTPIGTVVVGKMKQGHGDNNAPYSYYLGWHPLLGVATAGIGSGISTGAQINGYGASIPIGSTHHVAFTFANGIQRIYVDGKLAATNATSISQVYYNQNDVLIGSGNLCCGLHKRFGGTIDDVRIWDHARTEFEISRDRYCRLAGNEPGLLANWTFDGANVEDKTGNGHDGTMIGTTYNYLVEPVFQQHCGQRPVFAPVPLPPGVLLPLINRVFP